VRSLRARLTVWLLAGTGLLLVAGGLLLDRVISSRLRREYDAALLDKARSLVTLTEQQDGKIWLELSYDFMPELAAARNPAYFQLWLSDGSVVERSRSLAGRDLPLRGLPVGQSRLRSLTLPDGRHGREVEISFHPRSEQEELLQESSGHSGSDHKETGATATLAVAVGREDLDALLASLRVTLTAVVLGLLGGTALLVRALVGVGLAPLDDLARRLEEMDADSLGRELEMEDAPAELVPVVHHLKGLLARLEASFARERSFSANLAHELRTPLAELRAVTEVALKWPEDPSSWEESLAEIRGIGLQMERLVVNLLALARCDARQQTVLKSEVPLCEVAAGCWGSVAAEAAEKGVALRLAIPEELDVYTDREKLSLILSNLLANAVAYGSPGRPVTCSALMKGEGMGSGEFALCIGNFTDALAPGDLPRIFDRFWRKDAARSGGLHNGLGLSLVSALCDVLGLRKEAQLEDGYFEIRLLGTAATLSEPSADPPYVAEPQQRGV
jgi:two-component system sensor histidine kinase QseC